MSTENDTITTDEDDETYAEAVARFVKAATWLGDEHRPAIKVLRSIARALDAEDAAGRAPQAALIGQFSQNYRDLAKRAPAGQGRGDALDESMPPALWE